MFISELFTVVGYLHTAGFKNRRGTFLPSVCLTLAVDYPSSNQGGLLQPPLRFFSRSLKNAKESYQGHRVICFTSFAVIFMKKLGGTTLPGGRVRRQSQRVRVRGVVTTFSVLRKH